MAVAGKRGARERVLEGRHVIGLFMLMLVFSGVFFALGYVMGRSQYDRPVRAAGNPRPANASDKTEPARRPPILADPATGTVSDWDFYASSDNAPRPTNVRADAAPKGKSRFAPPAASYTLQVAALGSRADALSLAANLQRKKFPAFVVSPQGDKYFRVQVGPYADQKSADAAKKGLEDAGFKAIVKH